MLAGRPEAANLRRNDWPRYKINDWILDTERRALISPAGKGVRGVGYVLAAKVVRLAITTLCMGASLGFAA